MKKLTLLLSGMSSVLDITGIASGTISEKYPIASNKEAVASDWRIIGQDILFAINEYDYELKEKAS